MARQALNALQVASMLVSASCGIGFLLGTGELAVYQGMAGCLYAVATALGLVILAVFAPTLWTAGRSVWNQFSRHYGNSAGRNVALLSLVWMTGVLAAQIRGGSAVLALTGLPQSTAVILIVGLLVAFSLINLSWLSVGFAFCMLVCNLVLIHSLIEKGRLEVWLRAPVGFANAIRGYGSIHTAFVLFSVTVMVVCGADYQQFVIAARKRSTARAGCLLAAALVLVIGFLPASAVIAAGAAAYSLGLTDPLQVVPLLLIRSLPSHVTSAARDLIVVTLVATALGSASSILRAMSDATSTLPLPSVMRPVCSRLLPVLLGTLVASRQQSLVDMMVDLNVVYITAVCPILMLSVIGVHVADSAANAAMATACTTSMVGYLIRWTDAAPLPEVIPLFASVSIALAVAVSYRTRVAQTACHIPSIHDMPPSSVAQRSEEEEGDTG